MGLNIICYGFDFGYSNNANAHCLNEIISSLNLEKEITIYTTTKKDETYTYTDEQLNLTVVYFSIAKFKSFKKSYKPWLNFILEKIVVSDFSTLLTISFPIQTLLLGYEVKKRNPNLNWIIYELDPYAYNEVLRYKRLLFPYRLSIQKKVFRLANKILLTHELYEQYTYVKTLSRYKGKFRDVGIPILRFKNNDVIKPKANHFIYVGTFYKKVRDPDYMLQLMAKAAKEIQGFQFDIYGEDVKKEYIKYIKESKESIKFHGRISKEEVYNKISEAQFLVNLGNNISNQLPSKVLEYIGYEKPIINFISIPNDPSRRYLEKYEPALTLGGKKPVLNEDLIVLKKFVSEITYKKKSRNRILFEKETIEYISRLIIMELN